MKMYKIIPILVCALFFSGCVGLQNIPDYIAGTYVNQPAEGTAGRYSKNFDLPYPVLFEKTEKALKDMGVSIRYKNEKNALSWRGILTIYTIIVSTQRRLAYSLKR